MDLNSLQNRPLESHKGDFGRALLVGGSLGMSGAISLAGMAALRSGAGLVTLAVPEEILPIVASHEPSYMTVPFTDGHLDERIVDLLKGANCVGCGPGLGRDAFANKLVSNVLSQTEAPLVLDADAIRWVGTTNSKALILTPHPGEFRHLIDSTERDRAKLEVAASEFAERNNAIVVLKGHHSLITDGNRVVHNQTGNPGMATGGSGDVLTGIIVALIGQSMDPFDAVVEGVRVHGLAGDLAAAELGQMSLIASDLLRYLPQALR